MRRQLLTVVLISLCLSAHPTTVLADSQTINPPRQKGVIFIVVKLKNYDSKSLSHSTKISVRWGSYSRSKSFPAMTRMVPTIGVVIRLRHDNADSVPLTVDTDGQIIFLEQTTRSPSQWTDQYYQTEDW